MYVYSAFGVDTSDSCWASLQTWAVEQVYSGLSWLEKLAVNENHIARAIGAPGSTDFQRFIAAVQHSENGFIAELMTRATLSDSNIAKARKFYPALRAKVDACGAVAQVTPTPTSDESWWDDEAKLQPTPTPTPESTPTPTTIPPRPTSTPPVASASLLPLILIGGALWYFLGRR